MTLFTRGLLSLIQQACENVALGQFPSKVAIHISHIAQYMDLISVGAWVVKHAFGLDFLPSYVNSQGQV